MRLRLAPRVRRMAPPPGCPPPPPPTRERTLSLRLLPAGPMAVSCTMIRVVAGELASSEGVAERGAESVASEKGLHPAGAEVEAAAVQLGRDTLVEHAAQAYLDLQCSQ